MSIAPIALFVYNRPVHTGKTIDALAKNYEAAHSTLYVYADGAKKNASEADIKKISDTREIVKSIKGFKEVELIFSDENKGLANSIIAGVTHIVNKQGSIIVLEDDIIVSPWFLKYMNDGLEIYEKREEVISIHAYNSPINPKGIPETFFMRGADCWGWATWKRGWDMFEPDAAKLYQNIISQGLENEFNIGNTYSYSGMLLDQMNGIVNSWAIRWHASAFLKNMYTLYPRVSLIYNTGLDNSGTHSGAVNHFNNKKWNNKKPVNIKPANKIETNQRVFERWKKYFGDLHKPANKKKSLFPLDTRYLLGKIYNRIKQQIRPRIT